MEEKNSTRNSRDNKSVSAQKPNDSKAKLELQKKLAKLDQIIEETNRQSETQQKIYQDVETESKKSFENLSMTNPSPMDMQNPDYHHNLIFKQLNPLKRAYIPKGIDGQEIRDEINLFLKEGHKVGRYSYQAYIHLIVEAINTFKEWVNEYGGKQLPELYYRFYEINKKLGYRKDKE